MTGFRDGIPNEFKGMPKVIENKDFVVYHDKNYPDKPPYFHPKDKEATYFLSRLQSGKFYSTIQAILEYYQAIITIDQKVQSHLRWKHEYNHRLKQLHKLLLANQMIEEISWENFRFNFQGKTGMYIFWIGKLSELLHLFDGLSKYIDPFFYKLEKPRSKGNDELCSLRQLALHVLYKSRGKGTIKTIDPDRVKPHRYHEPSPKIRAILKEMEVPK